MKRWIPALLLAAAPCLSRAAAPRARALPPVELGALALPANALPPASSFAVSPAALPSFARLAEIHAVAVLAPLAPLSPLVPAARASALASLSKPALAAAPAAHGETALSRLQASALDGAGATTPAAPAASARELSARAFDGGAARGGAVGGSIGSTGSSGDPAGPVLPSYLDSPEPEHAAWLAEVVEQARRSKAGRGVLARVQRLAESQGHPVMIVVSRIGNSGEYVFDHEVVTMDAAHRDNPPEAAAPVFMHELEHVLQLAQGLPADAFEMELEAYLTQFRVTSELGLKPPKGSFHASAWRRYQKDVDRFIAWLKKEYDGNLAIVGSSVDDYAAELEARLVKAQAKLDRLEQRAAVKRRVVERLHQTNQPPARIEQYRLDELAPLEDKLRVARRDLQWLERDLLMLRTPQSRARYEKYAARVLRKARAYHARLARLAAAR